MNPQQPPCTYLKLSCEMRHINLNVDIYRWINKYDGLNCKPKEGSSLNINKYNYDDIFFTTLNKGIF